MSMNTTESVYLKDDSSAVISRMNCTLLFDLDGTLYAADNGYGINILFATFPVSQLTT